MKVPMGFDAVNLQNQERALDIAAQMKRLQLFDAGYDTIIVHAERTAGAYIRLGENLAAEGMRPGIAARAEWIICNLEDIKNARYTYFQVQGVNGGAQAKTVTELIRSRIPGAFICLEADDALAAEIAGYADSWKVHDNIGTDFYDITRNLLDSCLGTGAADCNTDVSTSAKRAALAHKSGALCQPALLPYGDGLDPERMRAILCMYAILKAPVFIGCHPETMDLKTIDLMINGSILSILRDPSGAGASLRYYDPWHGLFARGLADGGKALLILNRCHGNTKTDITCADLGLAAGSEFELTDLFTGATAVSQNGVWDILIDTSDRPESPCCQFYRYL
jgi:hypothetical protein